jgi:hypothetical protein
VSDALERAPRAEIPTALDSITGTPQATVPVASATQGNAVVRQVTSRLGAVALPACHMHAIWPCGLAGFGEFNAATG